jgi:hypothetical protein
VITGSVIGQVDHGKLVIDAGPNADSAKQPQVTGAQKCTVGTLRSDTAQVCGSDTFKFRAVGGRYTVLVYGTGIDLIAVGTGTVKVAGVPDMSIGDGKYSLNGGDFVSLPGTQTDQLAIKSTTSG